VSDDVWIGLVQNIIDTAVNEWKASPCLCARTFLLKTVTKMDN